jgi:hypothetical protein
MRTQRTDKQVKVYGPRFYTEDGARMRITAKVRYDDSCRNGHNSFAITCDIATQKRNGRWYDEGGGAAHELIAAHFPELAPFMKWHLTSSDGPLHYIENTAYWAGKRGHCNGQPGDPPNLAHARKCAVWPDATDEDLTAPGLEDRLRARLPRLLEDFKRDVQSLGLVY